MGSNPILSAIKTAPHTRGAVFILWWRGCVRTTRRKALGSHTACGIRRNAEQWAQPLVFAERLRKEETA